MDNTTPPSPPGSLDALKLQISNLESEVARLAMAKQFIEIGKLHHHLHILRTTLRSEQARSQWQDRPDRRRVTKPTRAKGPTIIPQGS